MSTVNLTKSKVHSIQSRESKFYNRWEMYNDNYKDQVLKRLKEVYVNAELVGMINQIDLTNNIFKTIVKKISKVYARGVNRDFKDDNMSLLYKKARVNKYMKQANRYLNAFNDILLQVSWDVDLEIPKFNFRLPHKTKVKQNEDGKVIEVEYFVGFTKDGEKWAFWSEKEHYYKIYTIDNEFTTEALAGNPNRVNPYGVLPFIIMQKGFRDGNFFDSFSGDDLINVTLDSAIYNTFKNYLTKWQTFKQVVVTGSNVGVLNGQMLDPSSALTATGDDVDIKILDFQANLKQLVETTESSNATVAVNYNISPNQFRMTGQISSGFALQMENKALDDEVVEQQADFMVYERDLYNMITHIGNIHNAGLLEDSEFNVEFEKINYSESINDTLLSFEKSINLAIESPIEIIAKLKGITEEDAAEVYKKNIKVRNQGNEQFNKTVPTVNIPNLDEN